MHRRRLLAVSAAGLLAMAGCTADDGGTTPTSTPTETPTPTPTPTDTSVSVSRTRVLPSLVGLLSPDSIDVVGEPAFRYALVTVDATDSENAPAREAFTLRVDGESHSPRVDVGFAGLDDYHYLGDSIYDAEGPSGDLPFVLTPADAAPSVTLSWPGGETTLDGAGAALARSTPSFSVESFTASAENGTGTLSVTVRNTGDVRGWFVGAINVRGPSVAVAPVTGLAVEVAPGETGTRTHENDPIGGGEGEAEYTLRTAEESYETTATFGEND